MILLIQNFINGVSITDMKHSMRKNMDTLLMRVIVQNVDLINISLRNAGFFV
jgi:hypothetical protein